MRSVPRAVATGSQHTLGARNQSIDPVAADLGTDLVSRGQAISQKRKLGAVRKRRNRRSSGHFIILEELTTPCIRGRFFGFPRRSGLKQYRYGSRMPCDQPSVIDGI